MPVSILSELFELERIEKSLGMILANECGVQIQTRWTTVVDETPRIELVYRTGSPVGRYNGYAGQNSFGPAQPFNAWSYELDASIITTRTGPDAAQHVPLIGKVRWLLNYRTLCGYPGHPSPLTEEISPYHTITSCDEVAQLDSVDDENSLQIAKITFRGIINIRDSAWPPA